jgi:hypothetical protein
MPCRRRLKLKEEERLLRLAVTSLMASLRSG